ncbi:hypothetical protein EQG79_14160 [Spirosoma sordidisoli]|uniref:Uncharacterized protein n=1 Tax=Spirosoma sordidisoli TaxID=2502893 RepID=A0A4Q2UQ15_9BACT|nr:hypothetical protein EQG79_14160 [Spirosoma sordidisoli]
MNFMNPEKRPGPNPLLRISGADLMKALGRDAPKFKVYDNKALWKNEAVLLMNRLEVSPAVRECLADPDTCTETFKGLSILVFL